MSSQDSIARSKKNRVYIQHEEHVLHFEYPAQLIGNHTPALHPPLHVQHRTRPPADRSTFGLIDTTFYAILSPSVPAVPRFNLDALDELTDAIMNIRAAPGSSTLEFVAFFDKQQNEERHRFRLATRYRRGIKTSSDFEIGAHDWDGLMKHAATHQVLRIMQHLVRRESDRAVYHVRDHLEQTFPNTNVVTVEENNWPWSWASKQRTNVLDVLCSRLQPFQTPFGRSHQGDLHVMLPCGHDVSMFEDFLHSMTVDECMAVTCNVCNSRTLQPEDDVELATSTEILTSKEQYVREHHHWSRIREPAVHIVLHLPATMVAVALSLVLESLKTPRCVSPDELSLAEHRPTGEVMDFFSTQFYGVAIDIAMSQEDLIDKLITDAMNLDVGEKGGKLSKVFLPPGYEEFLHRWIDRAVHFLALRRCRRMGSEHSGVHRHTQLAHDFGTSHNSDDLVYNSDVFRQTDKVSADPASAQLTTDLEAVQAALARMKLPATATVADMVKELQNMRLQK